jgi:hypothetical protein
MAQKLARFVTVGGKTYGPKDDVPDDVLAQIKNPKAFVPVGEAPETEDYSGKEGGTASGAKLAGPVTVGGKTYGTKDFIPDEVAAKIKNPKAWEGGKVPAATAASADTADADGDKAGDGSDTGVAAPDSADLKAPRKSTSSTTKRS